MKLVQLIKMRLNDTYSKVHICTNLMHLLFRMVSDKGYFIAIAFHLCFRIYQPEGPRK